MSFLNFLHQEFVSPLMADGRIKHASATATFLFAFFFYLHVAGGDDSSPPYKPIDNIVLDCGSSSNSSEVLGDNRIWVGDVNSKFFPFDLPPNDASVISQADTQSSSVTQAPYLTARLSRSEFTYSFPVSPGQKFVRLYFYSASYPNFERSKAVFSIKIGLHTLLRDFNASVNADVSGPQIIHEFCVFAEGNDKMLNITFTPTNQDSYAFINGIEIVSMPTDLYYTPSNLNNQGVGGLKVVNQNNNFLSIENYTSLQMVYRMNIGGNFISSMNDTGMFRSWSQESNLLPGYLEDARPFANSSISLNYTKISPYTAPEAVYRTARTMGRNHTLSKMYNLTWAYPVDPGFHYMIRLHFCEFEDDITSSGDRVFLIYISDTMAEQNFDVFPRADGKDSPIYRDYAVYLSSSDQKKVNLSIKLQANPDDSKTRFPNVILNGIEIFKLNDTSGNLAGQNPDPPAATTPTQPLPPLNPQPKSSSNNTKIVAIVIPVVIGSVAILALGSFMFWRRRRFTNQTAFGDETSWWALNSTSTDKSSKTRNSNLPSNLCRYFSLPEIKAATKNFDDVFIIGVGGFGNVYKGNIDDGATQVAIKRLKAGSKQGAHEFKTEIEMLSQLRHLHLVPLIGYCNDGNEMILVYDYMSHGTLRNHLYGEDEQPLTWKQRLQVCIGAAKGLHYLHTGANDTIIHRDVKTTNILLDEKWSAKVSDFGLSKVGPANMSNAHISTVVKGSFGYLDPEYYRRQQLTEKSDVYSFGVVLCEVLCGRPPLLRNADKKQVYLAEWVRRCHRDNTVAQIVDQNIKNEISPECLRKFVEIAVSCIDDEGVKRPSMADVVWGLEFALQLHEASKKKGGDQEDDVGGNKKDTGEERWLVDETLFSSTDDQRRRTETESGVSSSYVTTSNSGDSSYTYNKGMSGIVFSEIKDPVGR